MSFSKQRLKRAAPGGYEVVLDGVSFSPTGNPQDRVLHSICLSIKPGEFIGVVGGNGAGKSTLLSAVAGELNVRDGKIFVGGERVTAPINRIIDGVGIVHQNDEDDLLHGFSIGFNISFRQFNTGSHPYTFRAFPMSYRTQMAAKLSRYSALLGRKDMDTLVGHLAGGVRQILNLIIGIHLEHEMNPCGLMLLDEHTARLDHTNAKDVMEFTAQQIKDANATAIMVTHRYSEALKYCSRIVVMGQGRIYGRPFAPTGWTVCDLERLVEAAENYDFGSNSNPNIEWTPTLQK
jgi:putative ABC transport system ATP-binding protein